MQASERWIAAAALLLFPLVMVQVGREWTWQVGLMAAAVLGGILLLLEIPFRRSANHAYRAGVTTAVAASLLQVWISVVGNEGDPANVAVFVLVLGAGASAFAVHARPDGMARAMLGIASVQALLTALMATAPATAQAPEGVARVVLLGGYFTALWLVSATLFYRSARPEAALRTA
jgi:hypothetical protein